MAGLSGRMWPKICHGFNWLPKWSGEDVAVTCSTATKHKSARDDQLFQAFGAAAKGLEAKDLGREGSIKPLDLAVDWPRRRSSASAGLLGSGRTETARLLFAADKRDSGTISVDGQPTRISTPRHAIAAGFAFCPEDRKAAGILPDLSIRENIIIALQARRGWFKPISQRTQRKLADKYIAALRIATSDAEKPIRLLSGGNQQKAILARWLASSPKLLILDEPTRGTDIGAKAEIHSLITKLCREGMSLLFISSELEEVAALCARG